MAKESAQYYIDNNDLEGAKTRLETTTGRWKGYWFEVCEEIFNSCTEWAKYYILDPIAKTIQKLFSICKIAPKVRNKEKIMYSEDCIIENNERDIQKCYLIEFLDKDDKSIASKVGTTIRKIQERIYEELKSETYIKMGAVRCIIHRVYDCGKIPAEGLESYFRAMYIKKYPDSFHKNDRFIATKFDFAEADRIKAEYLA
jgi:hypothetical protein